MNRKELEDAFFSDPCYVKEYCKILLEENNRLKALTYKMQEDMHGLDNRIDALEANMDLLKSRNSERELYSRKEVLETLTQEELDLIGEIYFDWMSYYPREKKEGDFYPFVIEWSENNEDGSLSFHRACISNRDILEHSSLANALSEVLSHLSEESDGVDD